MAGGNTAYQKVLRALGRRLDREGWREVLLIERPEGLLLSGVRPAERGRRPEVLRLSPGALYREVQAARRAGDRRGHARRLPGAPAGGRRPCDGCACSSRCTVG